jgi:cytochrome c oxidase assembly protein subunit 15
MLQNGNVSEFDGIANKTNKAIIIWLYTGVAMLVIQVVLGGITRLTGSGLSITEWKPILGILPPLTETAWQQSFHKYQQIAQFKQVNNSFSLGDYKAIFFWEWFHREWARLMGLVFIVPFLIFLVKKQFGKKMIWPLAGLFILGGLQGAIGWIMVESGLNDTDTRVSHIRLAIHFMAALFLLSYLFWFSLKVSIKRKWCTKAQGVRKVNLIILILLTIQLIYGAFMAGSHAALYASSWPDMNGSYFPAGLSFSLQALCYDSITIQFIHRWLAYIITIIVTVWFFMAGKLSPRCPLRKVRWLPLLLVFSQVVLGVLALLNSVFSSAIYFSAIHQFVGILLLLSLLVTYYLCKAPRLFEV